MRPQVLTSVIALLMAMSLVVGCGVGGSDKADKVDRPVVRNFSPQLSPIDFGQNLQQNPTFTNNSLNVSTDPRYPGKIVVFFQESTSIAASSVFLGGSPFLGLDPSALQFTQEIPGFGNVQVPVHVTVESDRIILQPQGPAYATGTGPGAITNLPDGQYTVGVFNNILNTEGKGLLRGPVFHTFTVGTADTIAPRVLTTTPINGQSGVGAGAPPAKGPPGFEDTTADVVTNIFGPSTPDITIRFTEGVKSSTVNLANFQVVDAGAFVPGGGAPPALQPAIGFPKLKSAEDLETLPSNGHEVLWRAEPQLGGFPFGTQVQVTVIGSDGGVNPAPIQDLAGNNMENSFVFQFQTIAPPDLPQNPFPELAIWWAANDRIGALDTVNQQGLADQFNGTPFPLGVPKNVLPAFTDRVSTQQNIPNFDPREIVIDTRSNFATCHTWVYVQSFESGQVGIIDSRTSVPVALINTATPGGIACQTASTGQNVLCVTNTSANLWVAYSIGALTPGTQFLNGPLFIAARRATGNNPRAISISAGLPPGNIPHHWNRGTAGLPGPGTEVIMYADFSDGVVNTTTLSREAPAQQFALGPNSSPNDISMTPCYGNPVLMYAAISQGGDPREPNSGKVAYYLAGPGCVTGVSTAARPDALVGDISGLDAPAGVSDLFLPINSAAFWAVAESGSDRVKGLGFVIGTNSPSVEIEINSVGDNPVMTTTRPPWLNPCIAPAGTNGCLHGGAPTCWYNGTEQDVLAFGLVDGGFVASRDLYICAQGGGFIRVVDVGTGFTIQDPDVAIPGIRYIASTVRQ
jgi:hypothetical protein